MCKQVEQKVSLIGDAEKEWKDLWCGQARVDYNGRPSDIYQPISSKTTQLPTEPVKDDRPISDKKDRYTLIKQSATLIEQSNSF